MTARKRVPQRDSPTDGELAVFRHQLEAEIDDGKQILAAVDDEARFNGWVVGVKDLLRRALGHEPWPIEFETAYGGGANFRVVSDYRPTPQEVRAQRVQEVEAKLAIAERALRAIDQQLERAGAAAPPDPGLPDEAFDFVGDETLRSLALRDYTELRVVPATAVKARALLAGSVTETVLVDALRRRGFSSAQIDRMQFAELIAEALSAEVIQKRTAGTANSVRDMRNLVHPLVELRNGRLRAVDANAAVALMAMVLEDLRR